MLNSTQLQTNTESDLEIQKPQLFKNIKSTSYQDTKDYSSFLDKIKREDALLQEKLEKAEKDKTPEDLKQDKIQQHEAKLLERHLYKQKMRNKRGDDKHHNRLYQIRLRLKDLETIKLKNQSVFDNKKIYPPIRMDILGKIIFNQNAILLEKLKKDLYHKSNYCIPEITTSKEKEDKQ